MLDDLGAEYPAAGPAPLRCR